MLKPLQIVSSTTFLNSGSGAQTGKSYNFLECLEDDTNFSTLTADDVAGCSGVNFPKGTIIESKVGITAVTVSSGSCLAKEL